MKLYDTLTKEVRSFKPMNGNTINIFVCGPTVYDFAQLGNAKTYIQMDVLVRFLKSQNYEVSYLQNITDIDDKILTKAKDKNVSWDKISREFENEYYADMDWLNNTSVSTYARATDHINEIILQVQNLLDNGHAYLIEKDGIYFEISTFKEYGKLSKRTKIMEDDAESRIDESEKKRGWNDFCIWKFSKKNEPIWSAPFGDGRPGWHIEDTAITEKFFGPQYDIHGGAVDLIFPHHEAELTIMESISSKKPFVNFWTHVGFLTIDGARMGKSKGNFITIRQIKEEGYSPAALRLLMLQSHYRSELNFTWDGLKSAKTRLDTFRSMSDNLWQPNGAGGITSENLIDIKEKVIEALQNDLNTAVALKHLSELENIVNDKGVSKKTVSDFGNFLEWLDSVFGLNLSESADISDKQQKLIKLREDARETKNWKKSDEIRNKLKSENLILRDTDRGTIWSWQ